MSRNPMPLSISEKIGKKHLTTEEKKIKEKSENKLKKFGYDELKNIKPPIEILENSYSYKIWKEQMECYLDSAERGIYVLGESDINIFVDYCLLCSNLRNLQSRFSELLKKNIYDKDLDLAYHRALNSKIKLTDKLFLNPVARCRNIVIEKDKSVDPDMEVFDI